MLGFWSDLVRFKCGDGSEKAERHLSFGPLLPFPLLQRLCFSQLCKMCTRQKAKLASHLYFSWLSIKSYPLSKRSSGNADNNLGTAKFSSFCRLLILIGLQKAAGGLIGLIIAMFLETTLLIIRSSGYSKITSKKQTRGSRKPLRATTDVQNVSLGELSNQCTPLERKKTR